MTDDTDVVIDAGTELSAATAAPLRALVTDALRQGRTTIQFRLDGVVSYDAAGLGLLVGLRRRVEGAAGRFVCVSPSPPVLSGIRRLGLHRVLEIRLDLPEQEAAASAEADARPSASG